MSKRQDPRFSKGGKTTLQKYGRAHLSSAGKKSWESRKAKNPNIGLELSMLGLHAREVKKQEYIKSQIVVKKSVLQTLLGT